VYTARVHGAYTAVQQPCTRVYNRPYTGCVQGHVRTVYTAGIYNHQNTKLDLTTDAEYDAHLLNVNMWL